MSANDEPVHDPPAPLPERGELLSGFDSGTYGAAFADVYDRWYHDVSPIKETVETLAQLAEHGDVLELGVGTGRLAIPLARAVSPRRVVGVDVSTEMLAVLADNDPDGAVVAVCGDMVEDLPRGPFGLAFVAYNTLFNLTGTDGQRRCFDAVRERLGGNGRFVIEAFVPDPEATSGESISLRSMTADEVVLAVTRLDTERQLFGGQFIEFADRATPRLRPWQIQYATPDQLDQIATAAGFDLEHRWGGFDRSAYTEVSTRHVSVYRRS